MSRAHRSCPPLLLVFVSNRNLPHPEYRCERLALAANKLVFPQAHRNPDQCASEDKVRRAGPRGAWRLYQCSRHSPTDTDRNPRRGMPFKSCLRTPGWLCREVLLRATGNCDICAKAMIPSNIQLLLRPIMSVEYLGLWERKKSVMST